MSQYFIILFLLFLYNFTFPSSLYRIILSVLAIGVEYLLEPLQELQVVLILALDKFLHFNVLHDSQLGKCLLQQLKVGHELVLELSLPIHLTYGYFGGVEHIN